MKISSSANWVDLQNGEKIFTWIHCLKKANPSVVVVIVGPIGPEYMHCHRSIRVLADQLASQGMIAVRYDHFGMGNSTGNLEDEKIWENWVASPKEIIANIENQFDVTGIFIVCFRSGSLLLEGIDKLNQVKGLVYWFPYTRGAAFVRDMKTLDSALHLSNEKTDKTLDGGGYPITIETQKKLERINIVSQPRLSIKNFMVITDAEFSSKDRLSEVLINNERSVEAIKLNGLRDMTRQAALSKVPFDNIGVICDWVKNKGKADLKGDFKKLTFESPSVLNIKTFNEYVINICSRRNIFAILTQPVVSTSTLVVFPNAGLAHHIGPNRFHVDAARTLATEVGVATLRLDLSNIGDSVEIHDDNSHHPYPDSAAEDINNAVAFVKEQNGFDRIVLAGLCSGAHNVFHAALMNKYSVLGLVIINPLTFYWQKGQSIFEPEDNRVESDTIHYQNNVRDIKKWISLFTNPSKLIEIGKFILKFLGSRVLKYINPIMERIGLVEAPRLVRDMDSLFDRGTKVVVITSRTDPGYKILCSQAGKTISNARKSEMFSSIIIDDADHTFSSRESRKMLIKSIVDSVRRLI